MVTLAGHRGLACQVINTNVPPQSVVIMIIIIISFLYSTPSKSTDNYSGALYNDSS